MADDNTQGVSPTEIEMWCQQAAAGQVEAVERLLAAHHRRLLAFVRRKIGMDWQGKIEPEDILQEALIEVFAGIGEFSYNGPESFYRWTTRIAEHQFIDHVRKLRRQKRDVAREAAPANVSRHESFFEHYLRDWMTGSRVARREEAVSTLMIAIARLPEHYRTVVQRHYLNQAPLAAVAADLGKSEDAVRRMAGRALERLKEALGDGSRFLSRSS